MECGLWALPVPDLIVLFWTVAYGLIAFLVDTYHIPIISILQTGENRIFSNGIVNHDFRCKAMALTHS